MSIKIRVFHTTHETDYEAYHAWSLDGEVLPYDDEKRVMAKAQECVNGLRAHDIDVEIEVIHFRLLYPSEYI